MSGPNKYLLYFYGQVVGFNKTLLSWKLQCLWIQAVGVDNGNLHKARTRGSWTSACRWKSSVRYPEGNLGRSPHAHHPVEAGAFLCGSMGSMAWLMGSVFGKHSSGSSTQFEEENPLAGFLLVHSCTLWCLATTGHHCARKPWNLGKLLTLQPARGSGRTCY